MKRNPKMTQSRKCEKGLSCGLSCINKELSCEIGLGTQSVDTANKLTTLISQTKPVGHTIKPRKPKSSLVESGELKVRPRAIRVSSKVGSHRTSSVAVKGGEGIWNTLFDVDGGFDQIEDATRAERMALTSATRYDMERLFEAMPEGAIIRSAPADNDGLGHKRAKLYQRFGFGAPDSKGEQSSIKQNGLLIPYTLNNNANQT